MQAIAVTYHYGAYAINMIDFKARWNDFFEEIQRNDVLVMCGATFSIEHGVETFPINGYKRREYTGEHKVRVIAPVENIKAIRDLMDFWLGQPDFIEVDES